MNIGCNLQRGPAPNQQKQTLRHNKSLFTRNEENNDTRFIRKSWEID